MDEKLQAKVCYNMIAMAGGIKQFAPEYYNDCFDVEYIFTKEELKEILAFSRKSDEYLEGMKVLLRFAKEELNGTEIVSD